MRRVYVLEALTPQCAGRGARQLKIISPEVARLAIVWLLQSHGLYGVDVVLLEALPNDVPWVCGDPKVAVVQVTPRPI